MVIEFLKGVTPEQRHQLALGWNWDNGVKILRHVLTDPTTDKATAFHIYWGRGPKWHKQYADRDEALAKARWDIELYDFFR